MKTLCCSPKPYLIPCFTRSQPLRVRRSTCKTRANDRAKGFSVNSKEAVGKKEGQWKRRDDEEEEEPLPKEVFNRIIARVLVSVGAPMGTGIALMKGYDIARERVGFDLPLWVQFLALLVTFGSSAIGIAYGALSTSWDPDDKGSLLGLEQLQRNWEDIWSDENVDPPKNSNEYYLL